MSKIEVGQWFKHVKRGTSYEVVALGSIQTSQPIGDDCYVVIYRGENGHHWVRPYVEFDDGRFEPIEPIPTSPREIIGMLVEALSPFANEALQWPPERAIGKYKPTGMRGPKPDDHGTMAKFRVIDLRNATSAITTAAQWLKENP